MTGVEYSVEARWGYQDLPMSQELCEYGRAKFQFHMYKGIVRKVSS